LTSRAADSLEETELVPGGKVAYQFSARGHELAQVLLALALDQPHDAAAVYYRSRSFLLASGLTIEESLAGSMAKAGSPTGGRDVGVVHMLDRRGLADTRGVVVDEVALELFDLLVGKHHLGELADPGVDPVHDLVGDDLLLEHRATSRDALARVGRKLDLVAVARNPHHVLDLQMLSVEPHRHGDVLPEAAATGRLLRRPE
jgi:hypothetical protein